MSRPRNLGEYDKYLGGDHAWGGGMDFKYFFHRYFGIGLEGMALNADNFDIPPNVNCTSGLVGGGILSVTFRQRCRGLPLH